MAALEWKTWAALPCFFIFLYGVFNYLSNIEDNKCEMTYMFENPQYIKLELPFNVTQRFPKYNLYIYGEGRYVEDLRKIALKGIPALFIPGSGGSYKQVRSLASVALRMALNRRTHFHFNFFSIDFDTELSGIYGGVLREQTLFLKECIHFIQDLYLSKNMNRSLVLIGHSMGGVVARAILDHHSFNPSSISILFTMASPHQSPVLSVDSDMSSYYNEMNCETTARSEKASLPTIVSISGGERDILVRSDLAMLKTNRSNRQFNFPTSSIPGVWLSTDHLCILWCKQLVMSIVRSLFDLVDQKQLRLTTDPVLEKEILHYYFGSRARGKQFEISFPKTRVTFSQAGEWIIKDESSWRYSRNKILQAIYILVPLKNETESMVLHASGIDKLNWIFACKMETGTNVCREGENLSDEAQLVPGAPITSPAQVENRFLRISAKELIANGNTHFLIHLAPSGKVSLICERYKTQSHHKVIILPSLFRSSLSFSPLRMLTSPLTDGAVFYNLSLKGLQEVWQHYSFAVETRVCKTGTAGNGFVRMHVPWSNEDRYYQIRSSLNAVTNIKGYLYKAKPIESKQHAQLHVLLNPDCSYIMFVKSPIGLMAGQFLKFYRNMIAAYIAALFLTTLTSQIYYIGRLGYILSTLSALNKFPSFLVLVIIPEIMYFGFRNLKNGLIPSPDTIELHEGQLHFTLLCPILYLIGYGVSTFFALTSGAFLILLGRCAIYIRCGTVPPPLLANKGNAGALLFLLCCALAACGILFCGATLLIALFLLQLIKLVWLCGVNRCEEDRRGSNVSSTRWHLFHTLFCLQLIMGFVMLPSLIVWANNLSHSLHLNGDPHLVPAIVTVMAHAILWQEGIPFHSQYRSNLISAIISALAVLTCLYSLTTMWRMTHFIATSFAVLAAHQIAVKGQMGKKID